MARRIGSPLASALSLAMPRLKFETKKEARIGFLAPLSGKLKSWAEPGYHGCLMWRDRVNATGGIKVRDRQYLVDILPFDTGFRPERALEGARKLVLEDGVNLIVMVGGDDFSNQVRDFVSERKTLVTTLLPSDLSPDARTLIAPCEVHPIYNVTGVDWLKRNDPGLRTAAMCTQDDAHGRPSIATYRAAFEAAGIELVAERLFPIETTEFSGIVQDLMSRQPDILCWDTAYEPFVHALTVEAFRHGFKGRLLSCTCDNYAELIAKTSPEFMENFIFQFPDFDDPRLNEAQINFSEPNEFYQEFCSRYSGTWSAVSWEYFSILEIWKAAVERARTFDTATVLAAMKVGGAGKHVFGDATWWGRELFGIDNALVGYWPVVRIENGKARIVEFGSILDWWAMNSTLLIKHMREMGLMWDQRQTKLATSR
ncbi:ABC transporter substrate-binding protein [Hyphomicrobium methylovorum]|uniref:ABC transporter substrate-binding protein n=1 Tax=Hyphomicrobium methylovorum TaxID=84 RepID=UPI0015E7311D|nr:ABC transporter substrate-binding protein [Hyphomicrobium methylovorum]MBA2127203.1 ABC transporter substrate-binding protein [Hyphomicrobium methylovorum]